MPARLIVFLPLLLPASPFRRFRLFLISLERKTLYKSHKVTQFGPCSPEVAPRSNNVLWTVPIAAFCHVVTTACCCLSRLIWCQKNGGFMSGSFRFSSTRLDRSALSFVYVLIASSYVSSKLYSIFLAALPKLTLMAR